MQPYRIPLIGFPDVVLHAEESAVKKHPGYAAAKGGDDLSAYGVAADLIDWTCLGSQGRLGAMVDAKDIELVPVHALESAGVNEIPMAMAKLMAADMELTVNSSIVQLNTVGHTGATGFQRLANQAGFAGAVVPGPRGRRYSLDRQGFLGQACS